MSTMVTVEPAQPLQALGLANEVRAAGAELKRDVKDGRLTLAGAFEDPRSRAVQVAPLLQAVPGIGKARARRMLMGQHIAETKKVRELTVRQTQVLVDLCAL